MYKYKDVVWLFDVCGIDVGVLFFVDDVCLSLLIEFVFLFVDFFCYVFFIF